MQFNKNLLSPKAIADDMENYVKTQDQFLAWRDFFEGGAGKTIIELLAGVQAIKNHNTTMLIRESSLQHAKLNSSITELAINKGVYRPLAKGPIIEISFESEGGRVQMGELIGGFSNMNIYSLENKNLYRGNNTLKITLGKIETLETEVDFDGDFYTYDKTFEFLYASDLLNNFTVNGEEVFGMNEQINIYDSRIKNSVILIPYENRIRFIFGDGVLGKKTNIGDKIKFKLLTFDDTVVGEFKINEMNFIDSKLINNAKATFIRKGTPYLDKEKLRRIALRNSVDGRWVQSDDFENGLIKEFGEYLLDVKVIDSYPEENIYILPDNNYFTEEIKKDVFLLLENKRTNALKANTYWIDPNNPDNYYNLSFEFDYYGIDNSEDIESIIDEIKINLEKKINIVPFYLTGEDIAIEITRLLKNGKMYPTGDDISIQIDKFKFINSINIQYNIK